MSILSYSAITKEPIIREKKSIIKESYLSRARKFISENNKIVYNTDFNHMQILKEANDPKEYFPKFRSLLDTFDRKIYAYTDQMNAIQESFANQLSMNYKPINILEISKRFTEEDEFFYDKYDYTNLANPLIPSTDSIFDFGERFNQIKNIMVSATSLTNKQKYEKLMELLDELRLMFSDKNYQKFRADIVGVDDPIYATEFTEELFNIFRTNGTLQSNSLIDLKYLSDINKDILNAKKFIDSTNTIKNNIVALYNGIIKKLEPLFDIIYTGTASSVDLGIGKYRVEESVLQALCLVLSNISTNLSKMMDIHMIAYTSKLDAIIHYFDQSTRILNIGYHKVKMKSSWYLSESTTYPFYNDNISAFNETNIGVEESITRVFDNEIFLLNNILESSIQAERIHSIILQEDTKKASKGFAAIKEYLKNIVQKISAVIGKFMEKATNFISSDKNYLEHYKDIILQHPLASTDISDYYNYDFIELTKIEVPELNYGSMKDQLKDDETFIKARFAKYIKNKDASLKDNIIATIQGDPINIPNTAAEDGKKINRTDLYNYVMGYDELSKSIEKDRKTFEDAQKTADNEIKRIENEMKSHEDIQSVLNKDRSSSDSQNMTQATQNSAQSSGSLGKTSTPQQGAAPSGQEQQQQTTNASAIIDDPMKEYFTEMDINKNPAASGTATGTSSANNPATNNKNVQNNDTQKMSQDYTNAAAEDQQNAMAIADAVKTYFTVGSEVLSAKLTLANNAYKQSMDIIRWHVQNFNNLKGKEETKPENQSKATNYETGEKGSPAEKPQPEKKGFFSKIKDAFS